MARPVSLPFLNPGDQCLVIAGLDPAIHPFFVKDGSPGLGASRRPGDDEELIIRKPYDITRRPP
jgi:hypothetical protein